jgi:hypothetical protein
MMRTSLKIMFVLILGCVIQANASLAKATAIDSSYTTISLVEPIGKIVVSGNVKVTLIQAAKERIEVYGAQFQSGRAVQQNGSTLMIGSYRKTPLVILVFVNNPNEVSASDKASVRTSGKFTLLNLHVKLDGQATADLHVQAVNVYTSVTERADLKLCGDAESHAIVMSSVGSLNVDQFVVRETSVSTDNARKFVVR